MLKLYGSGHNRIITNTTIPSRRNTCPSAINLLSSPTNRRTYPANTPRLVKNAAVLPTTVALAAIGHPSGKPYTKPATVTHVEYPITGGKPVATVASQMGIQPPGVARHEAATGPSAAKMRCE